MREKLILLTSKKTLSVATLNFSTSDYLVFTTTKVLTVVVTDINEHPPAFEPSSRDLTVSLDEDAKTGLQIANLHAIDPDEGYSAMVKYRFSEQLTSQNFTIDFTTGEPITFFLVFFPAP